MLGKDSDADALFARTEQPNAVTVVENNITWGGENGFAAVIDRIQVSFATRLGAALHIPTKPVRQMVDLPARFQVTARRKQRRDPRDGVLHDNVIYLVQQSHSSPVEVETTIFHELYGDAAAHTLFGGLPPEVGLLPVVPNKSE